MCHRTDLINYLESVFNFYKIDISDREHIIRILESISDKVAGIYRCKDCGKLEFVDSETLYSIIWIKNGEDNFNQLTPNHIKREIKMNFDKLGDFSYRNWLRTLDFFSERSPSFGLRISRYEYPPRENQTRWANTIHCAYCGLVFDNAFVLLNRGRFGKWLIENIQKEHLLPVSQGGQWKYGNIVPACVSCNNKKREMDTGKFIIENCSRYFAKKIEKFLYFNLVDLSYNQIKIYQKIREHIPIKQTIDRYNDKWLTRRQYIAINEKGKSRVIAGNENEEDNEVMQIALSGVFGGNENELEDNEVMQSYFVEDSDCLGECFQNWPQSYFEFLYDAIKSTSSIPHTTRIKSNLPSYKAQQLSLDDHFPSFSNN